MGRRSHLKTSALAAVSESTSEVTRALNRQETAVARAAHWGATWAEIAAMLGVSTQAAHKRFRHIRYDPATRRARYEPPARTDEM